MLLKDLSDLIDNYFSSERGGGRRISGFLSLGYYGSTKGVRDLYNFIKKIQVRRKSTNNQIELTNDEINQLKNILHNRWERIANTKNSYLSNFEKSTNLIYIVVAQLLGNELHEAPCKILMPTVVNEKTPIFRDEFDLSELNKCLLTDDKKHLIPLSEILDRYQRTYQLKNPFTNTTFTAAELNRIKSNLYYQENFKILDERVNSLVDGISPEIIPLLCQFIKSALDDNPQNPPELKLAEVSKYIGTLSAFEKETLMNAKLSEDKTFTDICNTLTTDTCSHTVMRNYLIPFLNRLEKAANLDVTFQEFTNQETHRKRF